MAPGNKCHVEDTYGPDLLVLEGTQLRLRGGERTEGPWHLGLSHSNCPDSILTLRTGSRGPCTPALPEGAHRRGRSQAWRGLVRGAGVRLLRPCLESLAAQQPPAPSTRGRAAWSLAARVI